MLEKSMEQISVESTETHKKSFNLEIMFSSFPKRKDTSKQIQEKMVWTI